jgi:hypothetical protein
MRSIAAIIWALVLLAGSAHAQSAIEHHVWQDRGLYEPIGSTARAITGALVLWGNPEFGEPGSELRLTFEAGSSIDVVSEGASWREWSLSGGKQTAEVFQIDQDPGELLNGNTLCGGEDAAGYMVFFEEEMMGGGRSLQLAVFSVDEPPFDINSDGLCGTFSYGIE